MPPPRNIRKRLRVIEDSDNEQISNEPKPKRGSRVRNKTKHFGVRKSIGKYDRHFPDLQGILPSNESVGDVSTSEVPIHFIDQSYSEDAFNSAFETSMNVFESIEREKNTGESQYASDQIMAMLQQISSNFEKRLSEMENTLAAVQKQISKVQTTVLESGTGQKSDDVPAEIVLPESVGLPIKTKTDFDLFEQKLKDSEFHSKVVSILIFKIVILTNCLLVFRKKN